LEKASKKLVKKYDERRKNAKVDTTLEDEFSAGRVIGMLFLVLSVHVPDEGYSRNALNFDIYIFLTSFIESKRRIRSHLCH